MTFSKPQLLDGKWNQCRKDCHQPFNSLSDDYHIYFSEDFKRGYLTSNRRGGSKDIFEFNTDIPPFESPEPIKKTYYKYKIYGPESGYGGYQPVQVFMGDQ